MWLKRILFDIEPDLFGPRAIRTKDGLQNKDDEIIVRRVHEPGRVRHDKDFYEASLSKAFARVPDASCGRTATWSSCSATPTPTRGSACSARCMMPGSW